MSQTYIWQNSKWPCFSWKTKDLFELLGQARKAQGKILAQTNLMGLEDEANIMVKEAATTAAIEGEKLDESSIRSSVAKHFGLPTKGLPPIQRNIDGLVEMLVDASTNYKKPLTEQRLFGWQAALFPTHYSGLKKIDVGCWRKTDKPMYVVSGAIGKEKIHFEAPASKQVQHEMNLFLTWWNNPPQIDGIIRAGLAHFWFVTIHPFEDGNGRIARALTDMALAQDEKTGRRIYSLSSQIIKERNNYYKILEKCQKGTCDVTEWLIWFLNLFEDAIKNSETIAHKSHTIAKFWQIHNQTDLNARQLKTVNRMLREEPHGFEGGMTNRKYVHLNKVSRETAKRDLADLEERGILKRNEGKGRSLSYSINIIL